MADNRNKEQKRIKKLEALFEKEKINAAKKLARVDKESLRKNQKSVILFNNIINMKLTDVGISNVKKIAHRVEKDYVMMGLLTNQVYQYKIKIEQLVKMNDQNYIVEENQFGSTTMAGILLYGVYLNSTYKKYLRSSGKQMDMVIYSGL